MGALFFEFPKLSNYIDLKKDLIFNDKIFLKYKKDIIHPKITSLF